MNIQMICSVNTVGNYKYIINDMDTYFLCLKEQEIFFLITLDYFMSHFSCFSERAKAMMTELCLASDEFDHFAVNAHNSITVCLKELRVRWMMEKE